MKKGIRRPLPDTETAREMARGVERDLIGLPERATPGLVQEPWWDMSQTYRDDSMQTWSDGGVTVTQTGPSIDSVYLSAAEVGS